MLNPTYKVVLRVVFTHPEGVVEKIKLIRRLG
jgi:hypothetical protein